MGTVIERLDEIPARMAAAVKPALAAATREGYRRFLGAMVHYTRESGARLDHAAALAHDPGVANFFAALAREERGHWQLALADLHAGGATLDQEPPTGLKGFHDGWMNARDDAWWLGALYALENVGAPLGEAAPVALMRLGLTAHETRFVRVHLEVDEAHGRDTARWCATVMNQARLVESAEAAEAFWVAMHREALEGRPVTP